MSGFYPPGVTGNEHQIVGDTPWESVLNGISQECDKEGWTDMDCFLAWKLGVTALKAARSLGGTFPSDTTGERYAKMGQDH